jgi:hypothetical protein
MCAISKKNNQRLINWIPCIARSSENIILDPNEVFRKKPKPVAKNPVTKNPVTKKPVTKETSNQC